MSGRRISQREQGGLTRSATGWTILACALWACSAGCDGLFYYPDRVEYGLALKRGQVAEEVYFPAQDGVILHGRFIPALKQPALGTVIHFHGNAQNLTTHYWFVDWLPEDGFNVFQFDYRGYGKSGLQRRGLSPATSQTTPTQAGGGGDTRIPADEPPTREGVFQDCVAALRYVKTRKDIDPTKVVGFGQSLGGTAMLGAVGEAEPDFLCGIVVEASFGSYLGIAIRKANQSLLLSWLSPGLPWLIISPAHSPMDSLTRLQHLPALFIHGTADVAVPFEAGQELFDAWQGPKHWVTAYGVGHLEAREFWGDAYYRTLVGGFFRACIARQTPATAAEEIPSPPGPPPVPLNADTLDQMLDTGN